MMTKITNRILCAIFGFYLTLTFFMFQLSGCLFGYFFNGEIIKRHLVSERIASEILTLVREECFAIADSCGLSYDVFDGVFSEKTILNDLNAAVGSAVQLLDYNYDNIAMIGSLTENVKRELTQTDGVSDFTDYEESIAVFVKQSSDVYKDFIYLNIYHYFDNVYSLITKYLTLGLIAAAVIAVVAVLMLVKLTGSGIAALREISWALTASGLMAAGISGVVHLSEILTRLQFQPQYFRDALREYLSGGVRTVFIVSVIMSAGGIILSLLCRKKLLSGKPEPSKTSGEAEKSM